MYGLNLREKGLVGERQSLTKNDNAFDMEIIR